MKINFIYSNIYFKHLNKYKSTQKTWDEVKEVGGKFEERYRCEISSIIKIIPELIGKPWKRDMIDVYIVDRMGPSFSHPLTLKIKSDLLLMLVIFTHELLHDFYIEIKVIEEVEEKINNIVEQIFKKMNIDISKQLEIIDSFHKKRFGDKK